MGALRTIFVLSAALCMAGCAADAGRGPSVTDVRVTEIEFPDGEEIPSRITLAVTVENPSRGVKILGGRLRIYYRGRRVAMFTLAEKVKIPRRRTSEVTVPLRVNVAHNSAAMSLRAAVRRRDAGDIGIEPEISVRSGILSGEMAVRGVVPLTEAVPERMMDEVWRALDEFTDSLSRSEGDELKTEDI